jgi:ectoine hydroxylase-related dioxygenase (phytanoyl-CoA dioxygenase family)
MTITQELITAGQRAQFEEQGYLILPKVLSPDVVKSARESIEELVDNEARKLMEQGLISDPLKEEPFETRWLRLFENKLDMAPDSFRPQLHLAGLFPVFFDSKVLDVVEAFLGPEIRLYPNYTVRIKVPDHPKAVVLWHQDGGYTAVNSEEAAGGNVDEMRMINVWSPLVPANHQNGCMQFVPGTHKLGVVPHEKHQYYLQIADEYLKPREKDAIDIELNPGDIVLFHNLLFHRGLPNHTNSIRWSMDWRYQDANQDTLRKEKGHIARSRKHPESAIHNAQEWTSARFQ